MSSYKIHKGLYIACLLNCFIYFISYELFKCINFYKVVRLCFCFTCTAATSEGETTEAEDESVENIVRNIVSGIVDQVVQGKDLNALCLVISICASGIAVFLILVSVLEDG